MKIMDTVSCWIWHSTQSLVRDHVDSFSRALVKQSFSIHLHVLTSNASVQMGPSSNVPGISEDADYTNTADLCSNPVYAFNKGYELSFTLDMTTSPPLISNWADTDNWIGTDTAKGIIWV